MAFSCMKMMNRFDSLPKLPPIYSHVAWYTHNPNPSRLFLGAPTPFNCHNPNPDPMSKTNRVRIPHASHHASSYVASFAAFAMLTRNIANDVLVVAKELRSLADEFVPREYQDYYIHEMQKFLRKNDTEFTIIIDEYQPHSNTRDKMFVAVETYLGTKVHKSSIRKVNVCKNKGTLAVRVNEGEEIVEDFDGIEVKWRCDTRSESGFRCYELSFHNRYRDKIFESYLSYILEQCEAIEAETIGIKLHMIDEGYREPLILDNPMTFKTLAIEPELKRAILDDLNNFKNGKEYYRRIGKAWKRGYLIYGPPGTGKSSLIASMANYLNYDIYDVELAEVDSDSQLKNILLKMPSKSIIVFEDFDELHNFMGNDNTRKLSRKKMFSRLLNFLDGIWSCCGEERVFVLTTKSIDKLDPVLFRPGRMDMHINMSYCTFSAFKQLALNYLEVDDHKLFEQVKELLEKVNITPAEIAGELMKYTKDATVSLQKLIAYLEMKETT